MDLLTLAAKITLDDSSYTKGIKNAESMGQQLAGKMSSMTVAVGNIMADLMKKAVSSISGVVTGAIDSYADYQQLIGGVETLFKTSADKVANYAKQSFKNTGLSANEYMETVTSFSASLLQGLNGNVEAAADIANTAVQDMADNANKMGTDIGSIQSAYMGFAKQNYTMLDNLKLGYGGTASEMVRLINDSGILEDEITDLDGITFDQLVAAIHEIQNQMGITGTTAKEAASTISGSKASLKAAWSDLLSAVGGEGDQKRMDEAIENFKTSFSTAMDNFIPSLATTIANSGSLVTAIADAIADLPTNLLTNLGGIGLEAGTEMIGGIGKIAGWLIDSLIDMFKTINIDSSKVTEFGEAIGTFIGDTIANIAKDLPAILEGVVNLGVALSGGLIEGLFKGLFGEDSEIQKTEKQYEKSVADTEKATVKAQGILNYMDTLVEKYGSAVKESEEWKKAEENLESVLGGSGKVFEQYGSDVQGAINHLKDMSEELRKLAIQQALQEKLDAQYKVLGEYWANKYEALEKRGSAEGAIADIQDKMSTSLKAYAQNFLDITEQYKDAEGPGSAYLAQQRELMNAILTEGVYRPFEGAEMGNEYRIEEMTVTQLHDMIDTLSGAVESFTKDPIWDASEEDNILAPKALKELQTEYELYKKEIAEADQAIAAAEEGITNANKAIADTELAASRAARELNAAASAAGSFASSVPSTSGGSGDRSVLGLNESNASHMYFSYMPRATGLDFAPYDGFKVEMHRGEGILTATDNAKRHGGSYASEDFIDAMEYALIAAMNRVNVYMSGEKVGNLTTKRVKNNINESSYARLRSYGG